MTEEQKTKFVYQLFEVYRDDWLDTLLETVGIVPCKDRAFKLQQILTVWFHGGIPSLETLHALAESKENTRGQLLSIKSDKNPLTEYATSGKITQC